MQTISQVFAGAKTVEFNIPGRYFILLATTLGVNIRFYKCGKKLDLGDIQGLLPGVECALGDPHDIEPAFTSVQLDVLGADTVTIGIGNGQVRYNRSQGSVLVTSMPPVSGTVAISNAAPAAKIPVYQAGEAYGASYKSNSAMAANTPDTIFAPGANVNGAILHRATMLSVSSVGNNYPALVAKNSAPASNIDGDVIASIDSGAIVATLFWSMFKVENPIFIPAGKGLYAIVAAADAGNQRSALYTLL